MKPLKLLVLAAVLLGVAAPASADEAHVGTIIVHKVVVGNAGSDRWTILVNGQAIGTVGDGESLTYTADEHGEDVGNTVTEVPVAGNPVLIVSSSVTCISDEEGEVASGSTVAEGVSLKNGETVTCTFTNTAQAPPPPPPPVHHHHHHHVVHHKHAPKLPPPVNLPVTVIAGSGGGGG